MTQWIDPVLVEKATRVAFSREGDSAVWDELPDEVREAHCADIEAAIRFVLDELGLRFEREYGFMDDPVPGAIRRVRAWRLVGASDWRPVEQGDTR